MKFQINKTHLYQILFCLFLFLLLLPISSEINFMQNDDWIHYKQVRSFMQGDFKLDPYFGPTFYTQGLIGVSFAKIFSVEKLPILTLVISISTLFVFLEILTKYFDKSIEESVFLGLLMFFNPIYLYSIWGFMTEAYFLFFLILSFYLFLKFNSKKTPKNFSILYLFLWISLFLKQITLVFPLSLAVYYLINRKFKLFISNVVMFLAMLVFYMLYFPQTAAMVNKSFALNHLLEPQYTFSLIWGVLILLTALLFPLLLTIFSKKQLLSNKYKLLAFIGLSVVLFLILNANFRPHGVFKGEFPYFGNVFERTGLYPSGIHGTKYQFKGNYDLYKFWDLGAKVLLTLLVSYWTVFIRKFNNFFLIFSIIYLGTMVTTFVFYDRYILLLLPAVIIYFAHISKINLYFRTILITFTLFLGFYGYQFTMDFILANSYVWERSVQLVENEGVVPKRIHGTNAWKLKHRNLEKDYLYTFSYDNQKINEELACCYDLIDSHEIRYPFSLFIKPKIYLYKMIKDPKVFLVDTPDYQYKN
ncbi:hypothetical protein ACFL13_01330 [Patescibacteria group bacterium]